MKKYFPVILIALLVLTLLSTRFYPTASAILGSISLLFTLALSTHTIYTKHAGTEHARAKILKEASVMVLTLILNIFLGGLAAMLTNFHISPSFGVIVGLVSALGASLFIGYVVKKGIVRLAM